MRVCGLGCGARPVGSHRYPRGRLRNSPRGKMPPLAVNRDAQRRVERVSPRVHAHRKQLPERFGLPECQVGDFGEVPVLRPCLAGVTQLDCTSLPATPCALLGHPCRAEQREQALVRGRFADFHPREDSGDVRLRRVPLGRNDLDRDRFKGLELLRQPSQRLARTRVADSRAGRLLELRGDRRPALLSDPSVGVRVDTGEDAIYRTALLAGEVQTKVRALGSGCGDSSRQSRYSNPPHQACIVGASPKWRRDRSAGFSRLPQCLVLAPTGHYRDADWFDQPTPSCERARGP